MLAKLERKARSAEDFTEEDFFEEPVAKVPRLEVDWCIEAAKEDQVATRTRISSSKEGSSRSSRLSGPLPLPGGTTCTNRIDRMVQIGLSPFPLPRSPTPS